MKESKNPSPKIVLITGGNSGIGLACAEQFASPDYITIITGRRKPEGTQAVAKLKSLGGNAIFIPCDFKDNKQIQSLFNEIKNKFNHLDYAINNAGIEGQPFTKITDYPEHIWDDVIQVNLKAVWLCMKYELELMLPRKQGAIVNISSLAGLKASLTGGAAYTASKHGVVGLTRSAAKEFAADKIRINCVCPALIKTPMAENIIDDLDKIGAQHHPIGRIGLPHDVAQAAHWLCTDKASFITGVSIPVDGGLMA